MAAESCTLAELKQLLITGTNNPAWNGGHLVRHLVDWYQRTERMCRHPEQEPNPDEDGPKMPAGSPCESLVSATDVIPRLVSEGRAEDVMDTLRTYSHSPYVDKEALVMCLAVAAKQGDQKKLVTEAHSAVREICANTHQFFLFIQICKMVAKKSGHSGWGRGLRRAVNEWYCSWEPKQLALEVTRHFSAHGWSHRDVLRLAHLKLKDLPMGTQVVLHYVFTGLDKTVQQYSGKDNTQELLDLLQVLDKDGHPQDRDGEWDVGEVVAKLTKVHEVYGKVSLDDAPPQTFKSVEVWSHMLDKVGGECVVGSVNRMAKAGLLGPGDASGVATKLLERLTSPDTLAAPIPPATLLMALHSYEHPARYSGDAGGKGGQDKKSNKCPKAATKTPPKKSAKVNTHVVQALHTLIAAAAKNVEKTERKCGVCVDVRGYMGTSHVWTGNPEGKGEVTGHEGAAATVLTLSAGGTCPLVLTAAFSGSGVKELTLEEGLDHAQIIKKFNETVIGEVNVEAGVGWAAEKGLETCVVLTHKLDQQAVLAAVQALNNVNQDKQNKMRLVLCGLGTKHIELQRTDNFLLVLGFDQRTPTIIRAYHERLF